MSDNVINLFGDDEEHDVKPQVIYSPKIISAVMIAYTSRAFGRTYHHALDFGRYLSSIWQTHPDDYRYINVKGIEIKQRVSDDMIITCKVTLDLVYRDGKFTVNAATVDRYNLEHPDQHVYASYEWPDEIVIESITVDNIHVLATGQQASEPKIPSKETPDFLRTVVVSSQHMGETTLRTFDVPPHRGLLRRISDGSSGVELDNLRLEVDYWDDDEGNERKLEIGVTGTVTFVNGVAVIPEIKLVNPRISVFKEGEWKRSEKRGEFIGYVSQLIFDKDRDALLDRPTNYELHPYVWLEGMNHHPEHMGHWVRYNRWRMKDRYDLQLHNGEIHEYYYPNANAWSKFGNHDGPQNVTDDEVAMVRQVPDDECNEKYFFSGRERIDRNISSFGDALPDVYILPDGSVEFKIRHRRMFEDTQIVADSSPSDLFRYQSTILSADEHTLTEVLHVPFTVNDPLFKSAVRYLKGQLEDKTYSGFSLVEDAKHGYIGSLNGESFADQQVDWVLRQLIPITQSLPLKPQELKPANPNRIGHFDPRAGATGALNKNNRRYNPGAFEPKKPKNNKALKKAAKKERTRALKDAKRTDGV